MDDNQRKRILQNIESLVNLTDFGTLCEACLNYELLTKVMINKIYRVEPEKLPAELCDESSIQRERHKRLFIKITKRGPDAFEKLRRIFIDLRYKDALKKVYDTEERMISISSSKEKGKATSGDDNENFVNNNLDDRDGTITQPLQDNTLRQYKDTVQPKKNIVVVKSNKIMKHDSIDTYPMESKENRGVFFMVNIVDFQTEEKRLGADQDFRCLLSLFEQLSFKCYAYENLSKVEFMDYLDRLLSTDEVRKTECFVMALMTHGQLENGIQYISFNDSSVVKVEEIEERFYHQNCPQLVGKPKIFIYPYCRGKISDKGIAITNKIQTESIGTTSRRSKNNVAQLSDVIKCYATTEGFVAHRDVDEGSWYIQSFVDIIATNAKNSSFEEMLKLIQSDIAKLRTHNNELQTASYVNIGFNKILYFNPGI